MSEWFSLSERLHARVQEVIAGLEAGGEFTEAEFDELALELGRYQAAHIPGFARLLAFHGSRLLSIDELIPVPVEAFRQTRMATYPSELDVARFLTSGTSQGTQGMHPMRRLDTYASAALAWGRRALLTQPTCRVLCLMPPPRVPPSSSLSFMLELFAREFDGRTENPWFLDASGRLDRPRLVEAVDQARRAGEPVLLLSTTLALLELLRHEPLSPFEVTVMQTGGGKGLSHEVTPSKVRERVAAYFGIGQERVLSEYGMTELSSQLYEGCLPGAGLKGPFERFLPPPWLRVRAVDPETRRRVPEGEVGLAAFIDLANVDSVVAILTADRIRETPEGIELLGRAPSAPSRGCSLGVEELWSEGTSPTSLASRG